MDTSHRRKIGPFLATMVVTSTMIGSGVFLLPASLGAIGSISIVGWLVAAVAAASIGAVFALLAIANPGAAGLFSYIRDAFGPCAGFVAGVLYWAGCLVAGGAVALAVAGYLSVFFPVTAKAPGLTIATIAIVWFIGVNFLGPRIVASLQSWAVFLGLAPVLFAAIGGWFFFHPATFIASWNVICARSIARSSHRPQLNSVTPAPQAPASNGKSGCASGFRRGAARRIRAMSPA